MAGNTTQSLDVELKPIFVESNVVAHISVKLTIGGLDGGLQGGNQSSKMTAIQFMGSNQSTEVNAQTVCRMEDIRSQDDAGTLDLVIGQVAGNTEWRANRTIQGGLVLQYDAIPVADQSRGTPIGTLHMDHDGFVGLWKSFLPKLGDFETWNIAIRWDLSSSPDQTRAVTSLGENDVCHVGSTVELLDCVFMIGNVKAFPEDSVSSKSQMSTGCCAIYWLGDLPQSLNSLTGFSGVMFPHLSHFFKDENGNYRGFLCKTVDGFASQPCYSGSLIQYNDDTANEHDWELVRLFNSSMIARWVGLDPEDDGSQNTWFAKGLSLLYTIYFPYRFRQRTSDYFRATVNGYFSAYFSNPLVAESFDRILDSDATTWHTESALAMRSCLYMIHMDAFTRRASRDRDLGVERPIDGIVADICTRRRQGETVQTKDWIKCIGEWLGNDEAEKHFQQMKSGVILDLEDMKTGFGNSLVVEEQNMLEMGFDRASLDDGIVKGVVPESAAAAAGLQNGDKILWHSRLGLCETNYESKFKATLERDGTELQIEYWPRGQETVRVWQSREKET